MSQAILRTAFLLMLATLIAAPLDAFARGPGGGGAGRSGARSGGARSGGTNALAKKGGKKKSRPQGAIGGQQLNGAGGNFSGAAQKFGGNAQNLSGAMQKFQGAQGGPKNLKDGPFGADKLHSLANQPSQKFQARDGQFSHDAQQKWQSRNGDVQQNAQSKWNNVQNGHQPFTAKWYADHPGAWQYTHPHADAWAAASAAGVASWLGWAAVNDNYNDGYAYGTTYYNTYVDEESPSDDADGVTETDESDDEDSTAAQNDSGDWLALGVYTVLSASGEPTSRLLQLSVNRAGEIRGVYYDAISDSSQNLSGTLDENSQLAQWSLDSSPQITFRAKLNELTQSEGTIKVDQPSGDTEWRIARQSS